MFWFCLKLMQNALTKNEKIDNNDHTLNFVLSLCLDPLSEDCWIIGEVQSAWGEKGACLQLQLNYLFRDSVKGTMDQAPASAPYGEYHILVDWLIN